MRKEKYSQGYETREENHPGFQDEGPKCLAHPQVQIPGSGTRDTGFQAGDVGLAKSINWSLQIAVLRKRSSRSVSPELLCGVPIFRLQVSEKHLKGARNRHCRWVSRVPHLTGLTDSNSSPPAAVSGTQTFIETEAAGLLVTFSLIHDR